MRLPFLRPNRRQTGAAPPPHPSAEPPEADPAPPPPRQQPLSSKGDGRTLAFPLEVLVANIPERLRGPGPSDGAGPSTVDLPGIEVLSQIGRGEIVLSLRTLLPLLPEECVKRPLPKPLTDFVRLPLDEVVSRIPVDWLELRADQEILSPPEDLPELFGETLDPPTVEAAPEASSETASMIEPLAADPGSDGAPDARAGVADADEEPSGPVCPDPAAAAPLPPAPEIEGSIRIRLVRLLDALPAGVVTGADPKALEEVRLEFRLAEIMPQLVRGEVVVPLRKVAEALPPALRADEPRNLPIQPVSLPLDDVVGQIPASLFAMASGQVILPLPGEREIPVPFRESPAQTDDLVQDSTPETERPGIAVVPLPDPLAIVSDAAPIDVAAVPPAPVPERIERAPTATPADDGRVGPEPAEEPARRPPAESASPPTPLPDLPQAPLDLSAWPKRAAAVALGRSIDGLDINLCRAEDLLDLPGIGPALAGRIVRFREEHGPVRSLYQLLDVPGIGRRLFERITGLSATEAGMPLGADLGRLLGLPPGRSPRLREIGAGCERLPGVDAAAFASRDGLVITGRAGEGMDLDRVAACAPMLLRRISRYTREAGWGKVRAFSVLADPKSLTIFATRQLMLLVAHNPGALSAETIERLNSVAELSERSCSRRLILEDHRPWQ